MLQKTSSEGMILQKMMVCLSWLFEWGVSSAYACCSNPSNRRVWKSTGDKAQLILSCNYVERLITRDGDASEIVGYVSDVSWSIQSFLVRFTITLFSYQD